MADDDLDLDAMLDSALDEGFADTASTEPADDEPETEEVDLDSMLDDALDATAAASSSTASQSGFGAKQVRRVAGGTTVAKEPWPFLNSARREVWKATLEKDAKRQAEMDKQRPLSRAYRSFYPRKEDSGIVVHLGSGATVAGGSSEANGVGALGDGARLRDDNEGAREGAAEIFEEVFGKSVSVSGVREPPTLEEGDCEEFDRLKASYLRLVAKDVRARVSNDPDVNPARFPGIATKILA